MSSKDFKEPFRAIKRQKDALEIRFLFESNETYLKNCSLFLSYGRVKIGVMPFTSIQHCIKMATLMMIMVVPCMTSALMAAFKPPCNSKNSYVDSIPNKSTWIRMDQELMSNADDLLVQFQ